MIRVTKDEKAGRTTITVDGHLSVDTVEAVESCCKQAIARNMPVDLFLRDVSTIDQSGQDLLRRIAAKGVHLLARGIYTSHLVNMLARTATPELSRRTNKSDSGETTRQRR
jgi:hypothetical protein